MFPNVLIISHNVLSKRFNNGKTIYSLFKNWPEKSLAQIYFRNEEPDFLSKIKYFRILDRDVLNSIFRSEKYYGDEIESQNSSYLINKIRFSFLFQLLKSPFFYLIRDFIWLCKESSNNKLDKWLTDYSPDIVFFVTSNNTFSYDFALSIIAKFKLPLILYFTDDYLNSKFTFDPFFHIRLLRIRNRFQLAMKSASHSFVIGEAMESEYRKRYGVDFQPIMQIVEFPKLPIPTDRIKEEIWIVYLGNLSLKRWQSLTEISTIIETISKNGCEVKFSIFSLEVPSKKIIKALNKPPGVIFEGSVTEDQKHEVLLKADIVIHTESFDKNSIFQSKLSVSTKISEYLCFGKCILAYGPKEVASIQYLEKYKAAVICNSKEELREKLESLIFNYKLRIDYMNSALSLAKNKHVSPDMNKIMRKCIEEKK